MRLVVVAPPWFEVPPSGYGGAESVCFDLVQGLVGRGHDVTLIGAGENHTDARFSATFVEPPRALGTPERLGFELAHAARAAELLDEMHPDLVHDHSLAGPLTAMHRPWPTVATVHGEVSTVERAYYRALPRRVALVAISESQRWLSPELPWSGVVHNGVRPEAFPFRRDKDDYLLFLGRLSSEKGPDIAIDVARAAGCDIVLAAKSTEPGERRFFREAIEPRLGPGVHWVGEVDAHEKRDLLSRARCLLAPIRWNEPFGLVLIEAMACGTPVVALGMGAVPELVLDGVTGFVRDRPRELPDAIRRLDEIDPVACRQHVARRFSVTAMVLGYEQRYRATLDREIRHGPAQAV